MICRFGSPYNDPMAGMPFVQTDSGLAADELDQIRVYGDALPSRPVTLYGGHTVEHVDAAGADFPCTEVTRWLYDRMARLAQQVNARHFRYDLTGFHENFYYLRYDAPGQHFDWHKDIGPETPAPRKLSIVLQLSDPSEYDGGDFDVLTGREHARGDKGLGLVTAFPAYQLHRVTPVTRGTRRTLSMFLVGPNFR